MNVCFLLVDLLLDTAKLDTLRIELFWVLWGLLYHDGNSRGHLFWGGYLAYISQNTYSLFQVLVLRFLAAILL